MNISETVEIKSLVSRGPKIFMLTMHRLGSLTGNTSLIATFSSFFFYGPYYLN